MNILARLGQSAPTEIKALARLKNPGSLWQPYGTNNNSFSNLPYLGMGGELTRQSEQFDINKLCGEPLNNGVVAACVNAICKALPDAPLILENKTKNGWQAVDDHDCLYPLRHPNDDHSDADIWGLTSGFKATRGQAFWVLIPNNGGTVGEVHVWNPDRVTIQSSETEFISGYRIQRENGGFFDAPKNQVIHFRHLPNFHNPRIGWNPLNTGRSQIAGDNLSATYHTSILFNAGVISLLIGVREGVAQGSVTTEQFEKVLTNIRKANRERAGGIEGFNLPFEIHKLAYSPDEMLIEKLIEYYETRICSVMGVSQRVAGLGADPTYNNLAEALNDFWERRIVPDRNSDAATLNRQWLPLWGMDSNDWRFRFDYSNVPALQENKDELHKRAREDYKAGAMDLREYRVLIGYSTDEEAVEAQFEGVFYAPPKADVQNGGGELDKDSPETKSYDPNESRDEGGKWTAGGSGGGKISATPGGLSEKALKAKAAHHLIDKTQQRYTEDYNEPKFAKAVGGDSYPDSEPVDVGVKKNGKLVHGIEMKTMVSNKAGKITMKKEAMQKKKAWQEEHGAIYHTVVLDDQKVFEANGKVGSLNPGDADYEGLHDESKRVMYYRRGAGSFRVEGMHQVKDIAELKQLMDMKDEDLPKAAQPSKSWLELEGVASKRPTK